MSRWWRTLAVLAAMGGITFPALGYLPPATAILKRLAQRRADAGLTAMEVRGAVALAPDEAQRLSTATGIVVSGADLSTPAILLVKAPGRCRLELAPEGTPAGNRPAVTVRGGNALSRRGLGEVPALQALAQGVCVLLGEKGSGGLDSERAIAHQLSGQGVAIADVALGRLSGRVAWVLGGRPQDARPQVWIDKQTFQPVRLVAPLAGATRDVSLLDFGSPVAGDAFPRAVEVWRGSDLEARFTVEKLRANPKISDAVF